jgi:putative nucleotidyltransferase with HDIG domain
MKKRRPNLVSPLEGFRIAIVRRALQIVENLPPWARLATLMVVLVVATTALLDLNLFRVTPAEYRDGEIARRTVIAPDDFTAVDSIETEKRRQSARASIQPAFIFDSTTTEAAVIELRSVWSAAQKTPTAPTGTTDRDNLVRVFSALKFAPRELEALETIMRRTASGYVFNDADAGHIATNIIVTNKSGPADRRVLDHLKSEFRMLSQARKELQEQLVRWNEVQAPVAFPAMAAMIKPSLTYDAAATERAAQAAESTVAPVYISLKRNQLVIREGDTVTTQTLPQLTAIYEYERTKRPWHHLLGLLAIVTALYWIAWKFVEHRSAVISFELSPRRIFALVGSAVLMETVFMRAGFTIADLTSAQSTRFPLTDAAVWGYGIPMAAAALLVALLVDSKLAFLTGLLTALFAGLLAPNGIDMTFYSIISSSVAIYGIGRYRDRQSVSIAGVLVGLVNAVMAVAIVAFEQRPLSLRTVLWCVMFGVIGGLLTSIFTAGGLPINESVFGILTDVKLLELSNADLPVLGQMALRAPGTNQHSHAVGQLCEDAARAIGANPLLARIGALYHDIGKLGAPEYFVENQHGINPHDRLRPSNSARIIISHVSYGTKLAKEIGLPKIISDFIPQHHGTRTLHFFLRKAQAAARPGEVVNEDEFRYPGPKPRFKEAAIMMIADSCEAGARSLAHPDPENVRLIVSKIVDAIVTDGQLDECDLTLRELTLIRESLVNSLTAIYHARIDYPGFNPPSHDNLRVVPDPNLDTEERGISYKSAEDVPINASGEVEDEAISRDGGVDQRSAVVKSK